MDWLTSLISIGGSFLITIVSISLFIGKYKEKVDSLVNLSIGKELTGIKVK